MKPEGKTAHNERRKAVATTLNAIGVAMLLGSLFQPMLGHAMGAETIVLGLAIFIGTQGILHAVLRSPED